jgi:hypothetical protein
MTPFYLRALLAVLGVWVVTGQTGRADDPVKPEKPVLRVPVKAADARPPLEVQSEKRVSFEFRQKPWAKVLEWLTEKTGLPVWGPHVPSGTLNFIPPPGKTYTIPEVIDILNNALIQQNYIMIKLEQAYTLIDATQKINDAIVPRLKIEQLKEHGKTEIASTTLRLERLNAKDLKEEVENMLSGFGKVTAMVQANTLVLRDSVGNLELMIDTINAIDKDEKAGLGRSNFGNGLDNTNTKTEMFRLSRVDATTMVDALKSNLGFGDPKTGSPNISADTTQNGIIVRGTAQQIEEVKKVLKAIGELGNEGVSGNVTIINIDRGSAAVIAKELERLYKQAGRKNPITVIGANEPHKKPEAKDKKAGSGKGEEQHP